jgi:hypothetical protein
MENKDFELLVEEAIQNSPQWILADIEGIMKKETGLIRISFIISELYSKYNFGFRHIVSSMHRDADWSVTAFERLNFIDNNLDLIDYIVKKKLKEKQ